MNDPVATMRAAWGEAAPDWVVALAGACAASSQGRVAERMGRSAAVVSQVLRKKYPGDMPAVEELVRGCYLAATVQCPALGTLPTNECAGWRRKARSFAGANALRVQMYRACQRCPLFRKEDAK
jgi:hypothetical protein